MNQDKQIITVEAVKELFRKHRFDIFHHDNGEEYRQYNENGMYLDTEEVILDQFQNPPPIKLPSDIVNIMPTDEKLEDWVMDGMIMNEKNAQRMKAAICVRNKITDILINYIKQSK